MQSVTYSQCCYEERIKEGEREGKREKVMGV
jgi:hypothetical protein